MFDILISGGLVYDGTGSDPVRTDLGISGDTIAAMGSNLGEARQIIDATGCIVTPGFVDIHTHYDGQATWDPMLAPSSINGVTSAVIGNCGVGFAPAHPDKHDWLISLMEGVEDIPGAALVEGLRWNWESFGEYLDALEGQERTIDIASYVPHAPLRAYVMGQRGANPVEIPTDDELADMAAIVADGMAHGAVGFATSRTYVHRTKTGDHIGTFTAENREVIALGSVLRSAGRGVVQLISDAYQSHDEQYTLSELQLMRDVSIAAGRPLAMTVQQPIDLPDRWREMFAFIADANENGAQMHAQVAPRPIGVLLGLAATVNPFAFCPSFGALFMLSAAEKAARMAEPELRATVIREHKSLNLDGIAAHLTGAFHRMFSLTHPVNYEPDPTNSVAGLAAAAGVDPVEMCYDLIMANNGQNMLYLPLYNYAKGNLDDTREMLVSDDALIALSDAGAHCGAICDGTFPTTLLAHWGRDRSHGDQIPLPYLVHLHTQRNAEYIGWRDRGVLAHGYLADVNVIDMNTLNLAPPFIVHDLPAGGRRLMQTSTGYRYTIKRGQITFIDGVHTGALPGQLVRGDQPSPVAV